ncbi:glycosylase [Foetidibacter luteolus]|uniref:glycosylase n=1 Tax=Foetidibacter luteolus TaxID=2608880 RepID=UPI00129AAA44|nr:glycosylase [Foetidibacter luteolus]
MKVKRRKHPFFLYITVTLCLIFCGRQASSQVKVNPVPQQRMQQVYEEVKTPYKYGLILVPEDDSKKLDSPTVFRKDSLWYMTYIVFDGRGYETWLAQSNNLLDWKTMGRLMSFSDTTDWDNNQKAGYAVLQDTRWGGSYQLQQYDNKYWMSYIGGSSRGYEAGKLGIGMAYTNADVASPHEWQRFKNPVLSASDSDVRWWENRKLYKSTVLQDENKTTGYPFVMYYNANGDTTDIKEMQSDERIGMAVSNDMLHWKRFHKEPVLMHGSGITGDAVIQKINDTWVMFYFGAFWANTQGAFNRFACSYDMVNWTDWNGPNLIEPSEEYDNLYAHKSYVIKHDGVVYHFYCAVNKKDQRGIAVATSKDMGKSRVIF